LGVKQSWVWGGFELQLGEVLLLSPTPRMSNPLHPNLPLQPAALLPRVHARLLVFPLPIFEGVAVGRSSSPCKARSSGGDSVWKLGTSHGLS
jgi:hypothetical protein